MKKIHLAILGIQLISTVCFGYSFDNDVPTDIQNQIKQDLAFIATIKATTQSDLHKQIFGELSGDSYSRFFNSRVTAVGMSTCGDQNAVACVIPFMDSSKMWLTQNYIKFSHPQIARTMVVYHESRHTEDAHDNWPHAICPQPFNDKSGNEIKSIWTGASLAGEAGCDQTPFGSYGSSMIMLKNISKFCTNCTSKVKMDAGIYADDQFKRIIDDKSIQQILNDLYNS